MVLFAKRKQKEAIASLLDSDRHPFVRERIESLQNSIALLDGGKLIVLAPVDSFESAASLSIAMADAYTANQSSCAVLNANLSSSFFDCLRSDSAETVNNQSDVLSTSYRTKKGWLAICPPKNAYPAAAYHEGVINDLINSRIEDFEHMIVVLPPLQNLELIAPISDSIKSVVLVTQKNITKRKLLFNAIRSIANQKINVLKIVLIG